MPNNFRGRFTPSRYFTLVIKLNLLNLLRLKAVRNCVMEPATFDEKINIKTYNAFSKTSLAEWQRSELAGAKR